MSLSKPRTSFGAHSMTAIDTTTKIPYGIVKVIAEASADMKREQIDLFGGSNPSPWASEQGKISSEITLTIKEFAPWLYALAGYTKTAIAAQTTGVLVGTTTHATTVVPVNAKGTSVAKTTGGIASIVTTTAADLKDGIYTIEAASASTVNVYCTTDIAFTEGTDKEYTDSTLKVNATALTITTATSTLVTGFGFSLKGGAGAIAMTIGDTATFEVRTSHLESYTYEYGSNPVPVEFEMYLYSQKTGSGEFIRDHFPRVQLSGIPAGIKENEWKDLSLTAKLMYSSTYGYTHKRFDKVKA